MKLPTVIICAHNEADNIGEVIDRVQAAVPSCSILVVDDDSSDATATIAKEHGATVYRNPPGSEYGDGFLRGLEIAVKAESDPIIFLDAGLSYQPEDIPWLLDHHRMKRRIDNGPEFEDCFDVVIGSRIVSGSTYNGKWYRKVLTYIAIYTFAIARRKRPMDYSGFRLFRLSAARLILRVNALNDADKKAHTFNLAILAGLQDDHFKIVQVPVHYTVTNSTLNWRRFLSAAKILRRL